MFEIIFFSKKKRPAVVEPVKAAGDAIKAEVFCKRFYWKRYFCIALTISTIYLLAVHILRWLVSSRIVRDSAWTIHKFQKTSGKHQPSCQACQKSLHRPCLGMIRWISAKPHRQSTAFDQACKDKKEPKKNNKRLPMQTFFQKKAKQKFKEKKKPSFLAFHSNLHMEAVSLPATILVCRHPLPSPVCQEASMQQHNKTFVQHEIQHQEQLQTPHQSSCLLG